MTLVNLESKFSNFPVVRANGSLGPRQPFTISFVEAEDDIIIDLV